MFLDKRLFVFQGEVNVGQNMLPMFLKTAESLQVRGLTENNTLHTKVIAIFNYNFIDVVIKSCSDTRAVPQLSCGA